jgi:hypothetical protein
MHLRTMGKPTVYRMAAAAQKTPEAKQLTGRFSAGEDHLFI